MPSLLLESGEKIPLRPFEPGEDTTAFVPVAELPFQAVSTRQVPDTPDHLLLSLSERMAVAGILGADFLW